MSAGLLRLSTKVGRSSSNSGRQRCLIRVKIKPSRVDSEKQIVAELLSNFQVGDTVKFDDMNIVVADATRLHFPLESDT